MNKIYKTGGTSKPVYFDNEIVEYYENKANNLLTSFSSVVNKDLRDFLTGQGKIKKVD